MATGDVRLAERMRGIAPFHVMDLMARAHALEADGRDIVHMEVGEPDFPSAPPIIEAGRRALAEGKTGYTGAAGIPPLRAAISDHYRRSYGLDVPAERILLTPGASGALLLALGLLVDPGDEVLMADPSYPCNRNFVRFLGGREQLVAVGPESGYQLDAGLAHRHAGPATVAMMLATPSNPTGTVLSAAQLEGLIEWAGHSGRAVVVDEIYHGLTYGKPAVSALSFSDQVFVINSFSKYFGMTGWRLGWLVVPQTHTREAEKLAQNLFLAPSTPAQYAALAAFADETRDILETRRSEFQRRRDFLVPALRSLGFEIPVTPEGAFYVYADSSRFGRDSFNLAQRAIEQAGVAITPGIDFGRWRAEEHIRFAYTTSLERLEEGVRRLAVLLA